MKIFIIGGPGSGKSTLARKLSKQYNIPHFDLDEINWINENGKVYGQKRDKKQRKQILDNLLASHSDWIFEGVYFKDWINPLIEKADKIIVLNPSKWLRCYRCIKRFLRRKFGIEHSSHKETLISFVKLIQWNHSYDSYLIAFLQKVKEKNLDNKITNEES